MFISLEELAKRPFDFRQSFAPGVVDLGSEIRQTAPLEASGEATLIEEDHGHKQVIEDIRVVGDLSTRLEVGCARCLEPVPREVKRSFDLLYRPQGSDAGREELSVTAVEAEVGYYQGDGLLLEDVLREQILLAVPYKVVCREDCQGLCPACGKNLNEGKCACPQLPADARWEALKGLREQMEK
jgi:uncharacterized protein